MNKEAELLSLKAKKACKALLKHVQSLEKKRKKDRKIDILSLNDQDLRSSLPVWVILTTKTFMTGSKKLKPSKILLKHPIIDQDSECCLIVKDPQRVYKDLVASAKLNKRVTKVIGISKLRKKFKSYQQKRELRDSYDFFVADSRVISLLPKLLGKAFYEKKRQPIPIDLATKSTPEHLFKEIEQVYSSTYLHLSPGTCTSIKCGAICQTPEQIAENIEIITNTLAEKFVKNGWKGIRGFHIKTNESIALPIWLCENVFDADVDKVKEIDKIVNYKKRKANNLNEEDSRSEENIDNVQSTQSIHVKKHRKTAEKLQK